MRGLGSGHVTCGKDLSNARKYLLHRGHTNPQTHKPTDLHRDSMTESVQWANSVKTQSQHYKIFEKYSKCFGMVLTPPLGSMS